MKITIITKSSTIPKNAEDTLNILIEYKVFVNVKKM